MSAVETQPVETTAPVSSNVGKLSSSRTTVPSLHEALSSLAATSSSGQLLSPLQVTAHIETILREYKHVLSSRKWQLFLEACIRWRRASHAAQVFYEMSSLNIPCHPHLLTELLSIMCSSDMYDQALSIFDSSIAAGMEPTVHNFSPLLKSCGSFQKARAILQRMEHAGLVPNVISYTAAIKSCEPTGDLTSALALMDFMRGCGVAPNEVTYCCIISVASRSMQGTVAANMLREMSHYGFAPNKICYGGALTACARCGMWDEVQRLLGEMQTLGLPLQESVLISVINVCRISIMLQRDMAGAALGSSEPSEEPDPVEAQWRRALWLVNNWASKVENLSESVFTMAMDVCESAGQDGEVMSIFRSIQGHGVKPSKSAHAYALRASCRSRNVDDAVEIVRSAEAAGVANLNMLNVTLALSESLGRADTSIALLRHMQEAYYIYSHSSVAGSRNYKNFISKKVLSNSLDTLTRNFSKVFTEVHDGRLAPAASSRQLVSDITQVLATSVSDKNFHLTPSSYPMANKLLLDAGNHVALRTLLNTSLYLQAVNSSRLYEFATRSLIPFARNADLRVGVECVLNLLEDVKAAGYNGLGVGMLLLALGRLEAWHESPAAANNTDTDPGTGTGTGTGTDVSGTVFSSAGSPSTSATQTTKRPVLENSELADLNLRRHKRDPQSLVADSRGNTSTTIRRVLTYELFVEGRDIVGPKSLPARAYEIAGAACRDARLPELMLDVYRRSIADGKVSRLLQGFAIDCCARSADYWELALSIFEECADKNKDAALYNSAILACEVGRDWEHALFLLESMQKNGLSLNTVVCTSTIAACARSGRHQEALSILRLMQDKGVRRNIFTYTAALSACAPVGTTSVGAWKEALTFYELMQSDDGALSAEISSENEYPFFKDAEEGDSKEGEEGEEGEEDEDEEEEGADEGAEEDEGQDIFDTRKVPPSTRLYNTLIEALSSQELLVDQLYAQGVANGIIKPFSGELIDLHAHSLNMARAAVRYALNTLLSPSAAPLKRDLVIIVGKGSKVSQGVRHQLLRDCRPGIRSYVTEKNAGRLRVNCKDLQRWVDLNKPGPRTIESTSEIDVDYTPRSPR